MATIYDQLKAATTPLMGKFKNPIQATWEMATRTPDGGGGVDVTWVEQASLNIIILPATGAEKLEAERLETQVSHKLFLLFDDASLINTKDRIIFKGRTFNIVSFLDIAEGVMWIKCMCMEGVAT